MERLEKNVFANLLGVGWTALLGVVCIPFYIKLMGAEAFGLVGVFFTMQSICAVFDLGIGATVCREVASSFSRTDEKDFYERSELIYTLQVFYWLISVSVGAAAFLLAPAIASYWINPQALSVGEVTDCIRMMAAAIALQFPSFFYQGGLLGLQKQALFNTLSSVAATVRTLGCLLALAFVSPAPEVFFLCQIVGYALGTAAVGVAFRQNFRTPAASESGGKVRFRPLLIRRVWRFGAAYAANSLANLVLFQADKIILSRFLTLEAFGYYVLAKGIANGLFAVTTAVNTSIFPRFAELVANGANELELTRVFHRGCQIMSVLLMPIAVTTMIFSRETLFLWTGNSAVVENSSLVLSLLMGGMLLYGLTQPLYYFQVAHDYWKLISRTNLVILPAIVPFYAVMTHKAGAAGAAAALMTINAVYFLSMPLMYRRFVKGNLLEWLFKDICAPLGGALLVGLLARQIPTGDFSRSETLIFMIAVGLSALTAAAFLAAQIRTLLLEKFFSSFVKSSTRNPQPQ